MGIFGEQVDGGSFSTLYLQTTGREYLYAVGDAPSSNGDVDSITIHTDGIWGTSINVHCALYEYVDSTSSYMGSKLGVTETKEISDGTTNTYVSFDFSEPKPSVVSGTTYYLVVAASGNIAGGSNVCRISDGGTALPKCYETSTTGIYLDDPKTGEEAVGGTVYLYATYTKTEEEPASTSLYFSGSGKLNFSGGSQQLQFMSV